MRVLVIRAAGFVGSNVVHESAELGFDIVGLVRSSPPLPNPQCTNVVVDLLDVAATRMPRSPACGRDAIVHTDFVASLVSALEIGDPFTVCESDAINMRATPSLASHSARLMLDLCERRLTGIYHCVGGEATTRMELARASAEVFGLDGSLLGSGPPDPEALPPVAVPYDTSLEVRATAAAVGVPLSTLRELLRFFRAERAAR